MRKEDNLIPGQHKLTLEEQCAGGKASGESRRQKKSLKEYMRILMEAEVGKDKDGNPITGAEAMAQKVFKEGLKGDWKAWELARDTAGEKPVDKVVVAEIDKDIIDEVESAVEEERNGEERSG